MNSKKEVAETTRKRTETGNDDSSRTAAGNLRRECSLGRFQRRAEQTSARDDGGGLGSRCVDGLMGYLQWSFSSLILPSLLGKQQHPELLLGRVRSSMPMARHCWGGEQNPPQQLHGTALSSAIALQPG